MSNYANACELIEKMSKDELRELLQKILLHDDEWCKQIVRDCAQALDRDMLQPIIDEIDALIDSDWESMDDVDSYSLSVWL